MKSLLLLLHIVIIVVHKMQYIIAITSLDFLKKFIQKLIACECT